MLTNNIQYWIIIFLTKLLVVMKKNLFNVFINNLINEKKQHFIETIQCLHIILFLFYKICIDSNWQILFSKVKSYCGSMINDILMMFWISKQKDIDLSKLIKRRNARALLITCAAMAIRSLKTSNTKQKALVCTLKHRYNCDSSSSHL